METNQLTESANITMSLIRNSPSKKLVILSSGSMVLDKTGQPKFEVLVEIDGQRKNYRPNKTTMRNLQKKFGTNSDSWVGKILDLSLGNIEGKDAILGVPQ
jgi:hypothetical protein